MSQKRPIIGFTLDHEVPDISKEGVYSKLPYYAIRENYLTAISELGGIPLPLMHDEALAETYGQMIDGLVIIGGAFDVSPALYGGGEKHDTVILKEQRTKFEWAITRYALDHKLPILGICGGEQLLNVVLGGSLIQHIPDEVDTDIEHEQPNPRNESGHSVAVKEGSLLHQIAGKETLHINSAHHQAVKEAAPGCIVNAVAPDGVIEGIELEGHPFCLGVQWHPEYHVDEADKKIFEAFLSACSHS